MPSSSTMKCVFIESRTTSLTYPFQGCKDVEDKLGELVLWLTKLKDSVANSADSNPQETERRNQLTRFVSYPYRSIADSSQLSVLGPWKASRDGPGSYWTKGRVQGSLIKDKIQEQSSSSLKNFDKQSFSTRLILLQITSQIELTHLE